MQQETVWPTPKGDVFILPHCSEDCIRAYSFGDQFGRYAQYKSLYTHRDSLVDIASHKDARVTLAVNKEKKLSDLVCLAFPSPVNAGLSLAMV